MFSRETLQELFDFTTFTWKTYGNSVRRMAPDAIASPAPGSDWPALRNVLFHVATSWDNWLRDRLGYDEPLDATSEAVTSWDDLREHRERTRGWLRRVIDDTPEDELHARVQPMWQDTAAEMTVSVADILAHILLHERGHHGDVTTMLSQLGATPPNIDYLTYVFFKQRQSGQ